jgi:Tol biopolymer transport system component/DNA-binding winged helix-turn-helix (wHTH) protein
MPDTGLPTVKIRFDAFEFDFQIGELRKEGQRVRLQEQPSRVLFRLLQRPGEVVTREELRLDLWPADTYVDFDHGLNSAVARLRETLQDSADKPRYVETISKRGYRLIAPVHTGEQPAAHTPEAIPSNASQGVSRTPVSRRFWAAAVFLVTSFCAVAIWAMYRPDTDKQLSKIEVVPLIGLRGFQATPALSPDGSLVAFRQSDGARNAGIYVAVVGADKSIQLTKNPGDCCPAWSPDGRQIAFSRYSDRTLSILTVPALGGTERRVYQGPDSMGGGLSWSPDGSFLAFPESRPEDPTRSWISLLSLANFSTRQISSAPPGSLDRSPMFSPNGKELAFIRSTVAGVTNDIFVMPVNGGRAKRLTFDNRPIMGSPAWTADSHEIVFSSNRGAATGLWRVCATGCSAPRPVAGPVGEAKWPSIPANGVSSLVYEQGLSTFNIWQLHLKDAKRYERPASVLISEKGDKMRPQLSPDGKKIAFESNRLGFWDIWTCDLEAKTCDQITSLHGTAGRARWSPDGHRIAFEFHPKERSEIYVVEIPGGVPHIVTTVPGADNLSPSWSRDGKSLYFASKRGSEPFQIWKMPLQGGPAVQLTKHAGISPEESQDGRYLYYCKYEQGGLWRLPLGGSEETEVLKDVGGGGWPNWALSSEGVYFLKFGKFAEVSIEFLEFGTSKIHRIWTLQKEPGWGLSLSPDGKSIVYIQDEFAESNLMLVTNFH